jgi:hypothetical protein
MDRADGYFVHPLPTHGRERKWLAIVRELPPVGVFPQRVIPVWPEAVLDERARVGMAYEEDAEEISDLAFES